MSFSGIKEEIKEEAKVLAAVILDGVDENGKGLVAFDEKRGVKNKRPPMPSQDVDVEEAFCEEQIKQAIANSLQDQDREASDENDLQAVLKRSQVETLGGAFKDKDVRDDKTTSTLSVSEFEKLWNMPEVTEIWKVAEGGIVREANSQNCKGDVKKAQYGRITCKGMDNLAGHLNINERDVFVDIGESREISCLLVNLCCLFPRLFGCHCFLLVVALLARLPCLTPCLMPCPPPLHHHQVTALVTLLSRWLLPRDAERKGLSLWMHETM